MHDLCLTQRNAAFNGYATAHDGQGDFEMAWDRYDAEYGPGDYGDGKLYRGLSDRDHSDHDYDVARDQDDEAEDEDEDEGEQ